MRTDDNNTLKAGLLDQKAPNRKPSMLTNLPPRKSLQTRKSSHKRPQLRDLNSHKVVFISTMFTMIFSPFNGVQNFLHETMKENGYENLGLLALTIFYISFGIGSFLTPQYSQSVEYKYLFLISFLPMSAFFFSLWLSLYCIVPEQAEFAFCSSGTIYIIVFICAVLAGIGTSLLWITKSIYITDCSNPFNKAKMFGIFSSIAPWTYFIGPIFTGFVIHDFGATNLFKVTIYICLLTSLMALGVKKPEKDSDDLQLMIEMSGFAGADPSNLEGEGGLVQRSVVIPRMEYFTKEFFWKCLTTQKMMIFYPLFLASACNFSIFITYCSTDVFEIIKGDNMDSGSILFSQELGKIAWVFLAFGLGEVLADRFFSAKVNTNKEAALSMVYKVFMVCAILHLIQHSVNWYPLYIPLAFLYGVGDAGSQEVIGGLISMKFIERFEPFTCFRIVYFCALGVFFLVNLGVSHGAPVVSFVLFMCLTIFAWLNNYKFFTIQT